MEALLIYLAKAAGLTGLFYLAYYLLLRKETFFGGNRKFLLAGLLTSAALPLVVFTKTVWVDPQPVQQQYYTPEQLLQLQQAVAAQPQEAPVNWPGIFALLYIAGILFFTARFIIELLAVRRLLKGQVVIKTNGLKYIDSQKVQSPFSFFNYIVYNSKTVSETELQNIISHERVHSIQKHSLDMVISQLYCIAFWFNPFAWLYKKAVAQNLEFIADAEAAKEIDDLADYQKTLLKITVQPKSTAIINHFYQSLIKKRIVMLNKKQSKMRNTWKYTVVLPALAAFMFAFQFKVQAQVKENKEAVVATYQKMKVALEITKDSKDEELENEKGFFKKEFDADLNYSDIKRNDKGEITAIKVTVTTPQQNEVYQISGTAPIKPFTVEIEKDKDMPGKVSFGTAGITAGSLRIDADYPLVPGVPAYPGPPPAAGSIPAPTAPPAPPAHAVQGYGFNGTQNSIKIHNTNLLLVLNGTKKEQGEAVNIPPDEQIAGIVMLDKKEARKKYGKDGKNGAMEITTKPQYKVAGIQSFSGPGNYQNSNQSGSYLFTTMGPLDDERLAKIMAERAERAYVFHSVDVQPIEFAALNSIDMQELQSRLKALKFDIEEFNFDDAKLLSLEKQELNEVKMQLEQEIQEMMKAEQNMMKERKKAIEERQKAKEKSKNQ